MRSNLSKALTTGIVVCSLSLPFQVSASEAEVNFVNPEKFSDIYVSNKSRKQSLKVVKKDITKLFQKLTKKYISTDHKLKVQISNIDLPGYIDYMRGEGNRDIRIVKDLEHYRIKFNFELFDSSGKLLKSGEKQIKEFVDHSPTRMRRNEFGTVSQFADDIEDWLKAEFES